MADAPLTPAQVAMIPAPAGLRSLFVTEVYQTDLGGTPLDPLLARLLDACLALAAEDKAGQDWADAQGYLGYTSFDSIDDLPARLPVFGELHALLDVHALVFARLLEMDLRGRPLRIQRSWVNLLRPGGMHSGHVHPHSAISGTIYLSVPGGAGAIQFEDPRHTQMMHAPLRMANARPDRQAFAAIAPKRGTLLLWESWLRHEVSTHRGAGERVSISFNYDLG